MSEFSANAVQVVNPGESIVFTDTPVPNQNGLVRHRDGTGNFLLSGYVSPQNRGQMCQCNAARAANYIVDFGANISIPTGGTVEPISVAVSIGGATIPASTMTVTPAAVDEYFNVSRALNVSIWKGCCENVSIRNVSEQPIQVSNANIIFARPDLR